jgi:CheY-like chemotaxis protein
LELQSTTTVHIDDYLGNGESILIVDDAPEQRALAERMLKRLRYDVATAVSGEEAVAMVEKRPYDLLVLDMIMPPGINGLDTYKRMRDFKADQKAVIASGYAMSDHVQKAQQLGAGAYVKKPFTLETIGLAVRAELDRE